jgi:hypothetical protein
LRGLGTISILSDVSGESTVATFTFFSLSVFFDDFTEPLISGLSTLLFSDSILSIGVAF